MAAIVRKGLLFLVIATVASAAGHWASTWLYPTPSPVVATDSSTADAREVELANLKGDRQSLKAWPGKLLLVNFWATWCAPCREEIPLLIDLQKRYESRGLQVIGVAIDNQGAVAHFSDQLGMNYPILIGQDDAIALMARYGNRIGSLPFSVVVDRDGRIAARKLGIYRRAEVEALIQSLLPSAS